MLRWEDNSRYPRQRCSQGELRVLEHPLGSEAGLGKMLKFEVLSLGSGGTPREMPKSKCAPPPPLVPVVATPLHNNVGNVAVVPGNSNAYATAGMEHAGYCCLKSRESRLN